MNFDFKSRKVKCGSSNQGSQRRKQSVADVFQANGEDKMFIEKIFVRG